MAEIGCGSGRRQQQLEITEINKQHAQPMRIWDEGQAQMSTEADRSSRSPILNPLRFTSATWFRCPLSPDTLPRLSCSFGSNSPTGQNYTIPQLPNSCANSACSVRSSASSLYAFTARMASRRKSAVSMTSLAILATPQTLTLSSSLSEGGVPSGPGLDLLVLNELAIDLQLHLEDATVKLGSQGVLQGVALDQPIQFLELLDQPMLALFQSGQQLGCLSARVFVFDVEHVGAEFLELGGSGRRSGAEAAEGAQDEPCRALHYHHNQFRTTHIPDSCERNDRNHTVWDEMRREKCACGPQSPVAAMLLSRSRSSLLMEAETRSKQDRLQSISALSPRSFCSSRASVSRAHPDASSGWPWSQWSSTHPNMRCVSRWQDGWSCRCACHMKSASRSAATACAVWVCRKRNSTQWRQDSSKVRRLKGKLSTNCECCTHAPNTHSIFISLPNRKGCSLQTALMARSVRLYLLQFSGFYRYWLMAAFSSEEGLQKRRESRTKTVMDRQQSKSCFKSTEKTGRKAVLSSTITAFEF